MAGFISLYLLPPVVIMGAPIIIQVLVNVAREEGLEGFSVMMLIGNPFAWALVSIWIIIASGLLMIPFDKYRGHASPGHVGLPPEYTDNCGGAYMTETGSFLVCHSIWFHQSLYVYNNFPYIMGVMYLFTLTLSIYLWHQSKKSSKLQVEKKGTVIPKQSLFAPYEICHGVDYHPKILEFDVKQWAIVRIGFLSWQVLVIAFFYAAYLLHGFNWGNFVAVLLQSYYIVKASIRETTYLASLDAHGTKPGFYVLWTAMNITPVMNTFTSYHFVAHTPDLNFISNLGIFLAGFLFIYVKFDIEAQKDLFKLTNGNCKIWGHKAMYVEAITEAEENQPKPRLLTSGYWGQARHLHYLLEILSAMCWGLPGINQGIWPFLSCFYIIIVLAYQMFHNETKCARKYGGLWTEYCKIVKYKLIPYVF